MHSDSEKIKSETHLRAADEQMKLRVTDDENHQSEESGQNVEPAQLPSPAVSKKKPKKEYVRLTFEQKRNSLLTYLAGMALWWGYQYVMWPGYIMPWLNHQGVRTYLFCLVVWFLIGGVIYCQTRGWGKVLCLLVFALPLIICPVLGPAIVTLGSPEFVRLMFH